MNFSSLITLCLLFLAACGETNSSSDSPTDTVPDETKCRAPDYMVSVGETCDTVAKDCGNAFCEPSLVCVDSICMSVTDAGTNTDG